MCTLSAHYMNVLMHLRIKLDAVVEVRGAVPALPSFP